MAHRSVRSTRCRAIADNSLEASNNAACWYLRRDRHAILRALNIPSAVNSLQACNTKDLVIKKMVYLYLCNYAQSNPELSLLAVNTLQKDWCVSAAEQARADFAAGRLVGTPRVAPQPYYRLICDFCTANRQLSNGCARVFVVPVTRAAVDVICACDPTDLLFCTVQPR